MDDFCPFGNAMGAQTGLTGVTDAFFAAFCPTAGAAADEP